MTQTYIPHPSEIYSLSISELTDLYNRLVAMLPEEGRPKTIKKFRTVKQGQGKVRKLIKTLTPDRNGQLPLDKNKQRDEARAAQIKERAEKMAKAKADKEADKVAKQEEKAAKAKAKAEAKEAAKSAKQEEKAAKAKAKAEAKEAAKQARVKLAAERAEARAKAKAERANQPRKHKGTNLLPGEEVTPCREGTKQSIMVDLLSRPEGATMEELLDALSGGKKPWAEVTVRSGFGWDMKQHGYGVRSVVKEGEDERFFLVLPHGVKKVPEHTPRKSAAAE
jgi:hypothetical protein